MATGYVPDVGDIVWLQFAGRPPAVVLGPASYNGRSGMILCCPTTTRIKVCPFEVILAGTPSSTVLADRVKSQDRRAGKALRKGRIGAAELAEVRAKLVALIG